MNSIQLPNSAPDRFVWFGGAIDDPTAYQISRMRESSEPMGLVLPVVRGGILRTIQLGINRASIDLFGFDALSWEDMRSAIQRDTTNDWYGEDLEFKRQLFQDGGNRFEQMARIRSKDGWFLMRFNWERIDGSNLIVGRGSRESDLADRPELLVAV